MSYKEFINDPSVKKTLMKMFNEYKDSGKYDKYDNEYDSSDDMHHDVHDPIEAFNQSNQERLGKRSRPPITGDAVYEIVSHFDTVPDDVKYKIRNNIPLDSYDGDDGSHHNVYSKYGKKSASRKKSAPMFQLPY